MRKKIDPVVDEAIETLNMKDGPSRRRLLEGAGLFSATAAASALIAACSSSSSSGAAPTSTAKEVAGNFPTTPKWKFTFVNHVTDNAFFTPTQYGFQDAAALLGIEVPNWTGALSTQPTVPTMLSSFNAAVTAGSPGIATTVVAATSFVAPINSALQAGIPVVTYNANGATNNPTNGLAYIGQELFVSGQAVGTRLAALKAGQIAFTIDQSPYLQGFLPTLYLYLFQLSGGLVAPAETNTGLKFVVKGNVDPYTATPTRFEGSTKNQTYIKHSGAISV